MMLSHRLFFVLLSALIVPCISSAQNKENGLFGKLEVPIGQSMKVYLAKISSPDKFYTSAPRLIIGSTTIDSTGHFQFPDFNELDPRYAYRITVVDKNDTPAKLVRDFESNNYLFLINEGHSVYVEGNAGKLSESYSPKPIKCSDLAFLRVRDIEAKTAVFLRELRKQFAEIKNADEKRTELREKLKSRMMAYFFDKVAPPVKSMIGVMDYDPRITSYLLATLDHNVNFRDDVKAFTPVVQNMKAAGYANHPYVKWWDEKLYALINDLPTGSKFSEFTLPDINGDTIALYDLESELFLIDFWASWCSPCREENRETVLPLYNKYRDKNFEVISISMDDARENWKSAVESDRLPWLQLSDLLGKKSSLWGEYKVEKLPTNFLLNGEFEIVAKDLRGEALEKFVGDYFENRD